MNRDDAIIAGHEASQLLSRLEPHLAAMDAQIVEAWRNSLDPETRDRCWHRQTALRDLRARLRGLVETGRIAEREEQNPPKPAKP